MKTMNLLERRCGFPVSSGWMNRKNKGFTLIELLVVIAIISALAALIVWGTASAGSAKVRSRVRTELGQLVGAVESFHKKHGFYPADNALPLGGAFNSGTNQLYYELTGTSFDNDTFTDNLQGMLTSQQIQGTFGVKGFGNSDQKNSGALDQKRVNFLSNLKPSGSAFIPGSTVRLLLVPYRSPGGDFNPWHYNSSDPVNNTTTFDLWAEVLLDGKKVVIGNWKD